MFLRIIVEKFFVNKPEVAVRMHVDEKYRPLAAHPSAARCHRLDVDVRLLPAEQRMQKLTTKRWLDASFSSYVPQSNGAATKMSTTSDKVV